MDYNSFHEIPVSDPFLSLETNLDDITNVMGMDGMDYEMDTSNNWSSAQSTSSSQKMGLQPSYQNMYTRRPNQHSPPQAFYDPNRPREVGSLVSLLHGAPVDDPYSNMNCRVTGHDTLPYFVGDAPATNPFSPPNLESKPQSSLHTLSGPGPASMLSMLGPGPSRSSAHQPVNGYPGDAYRPLSLAQQLAAPAMQPPLYVATPQHPMENAELEELGPSTSMMMSPSQPGLRQVKAEPMNGYPSPPGIHLPYHQHQHQQMQQQQQQMEHQLEQQQPPNADGANTKEELLRMLANMSPSEVEKLKSKKTPRAATPTTSAASASRPSAVATRVARAQSWQDDDDDDDDDDTPMVGGVKGPKIPKTERRTAHNLIEKKYRCSINDRIQQLKVLLAGDDAKLSKSATLRKALDYIESLETENRVLRDDGDHLRGILHTHGIPVPVIDVPLRAYYTTPGDSSMRSPEVGCDSCRLKTTQSLQSGGELQPSSPPSGSPPRAPRGTKRARTGTAAGDGQSRVTMFAVMLAVLIFNPISILTGSAELVSSSSDGLPPPSLPFEHGRVLDDSSLTSNLSGANDDWYQYVLRPACVWSFNFLVVFVVLTRLLVYGEPVQDFKSSSWTSFVSTRGKARREAESGNLREAQRQFCEGLVILDRPLPSPGLDAFLSVVWQVIRHLLNWLWIGRWLARRRRSATTTVAAVCRSHAHTAALYHDVHQLHLMGIDNDSAEPMNGLYLALCAVNLAEAAGALTDGLPRSVMAQIYVCAALRCRIDLPPFIASIASSYFFRRARRHVRRAPEHTVGHLVWLFHPAARRFFANAQRLRELMSTKQSLQLEPFVEEDPLLPLSRLRGALKVHLLATLVTELTGEDTVVVSTSSVGAPEATLKSGETPSDVVEPREINDADRSSTSDSRKSSETTTKAPPTMVPPADPALPKTTVTTTTTAALEDDVDVVDISRLLVTMCTQSGTAGDDKDEATKFGEWLPRAGDASCMWWTHLLTCANYYRAGKPGAARKHYSLIRHCPQQLLQDRLALSVGHALCARKLCIDDRQSALFGKFVCIHSRKALETLRLFSAHNSPPIVRVVQDGVRRLAYEWVMACLLDAWRASLDASRPYWVQKFDLQLMFSTLYQEAFNHYAIIHGPTSGGSRMLAYELASRMLNGANPQMTWMGVRRVQATRVAAVRGHVAMRRGAQPDAFHLHVLVKLHESLRGR